MNKIGVGLLFGLVLGAVDGATAWFTPEARPLIGGILVGSSIKGMIVGLFSGWFARKVHSIKWGIVVGAGLGLFSPSWSRRCRRATISRSCCPGSCLVE
jgi:hypothetical protein